MLISKHVFLDVLKSRMVVFYALFLAVLSVSIIWFSGDSSKSIVTLQNITLIATPLIALVFSSNYLYNSADFISLLLTQPIKRKQVFWAFYGSMVVALTLAIFLGLGLPLLVFQMSGLGFTLLYLTLMLNLVFVALGIWIATKVSDKAKGLGAVLLIWLFLTLVYDGIALLVLYFFQDYPLMTPVVIITSLNPVDLARVTLLLEMDISALMGFTGAVYKKYFSSGAGSMVALGLLLTWALIPTLLSKRKFLKKDF